MTKKDLKWQPWGGSLIDTYIVKLTWTNHDQASEVYLKSDSLACFRLDNIFDHILNLKMILLTYSFSSVSTVVPMQQPQTVSGHIVLYVWPTSSLRQRRILGAAFHFLILWWMWFPVWDWHCGYMTVSWFRVCMLLFFLNAYWWVRQSAQ